MKKLGIILCMVAFFGCSQAQEPQTLDIAKYLALADPEGIHPNEQQLAMLEGVIPEEPFQPAPAYTDRQYWTGFADTDLGKYYLKEADELKDRESEVPISDEIYRRANREGNRGIYKPRYYRTMDRLEKFILAECMRNDGQYLDAIEAHARAILSMKSWIHPNHDDDENTVLEGKRVHIDLGARKFALVLALADELLADKLPTDLRTEINTQLKWRITDSYLASTKQRKPKSNSWIRSTSNWNSVCTSGTLFTIMVAEESHEKRLQAVGSAINSMRYYLSGFGEDGYCSEGTGYWNYGFGHYLYLAEILYDYSGGSINLFAFDNPEKLKRVANFPELFQIHPGLYSPFSDGVTRVKSGSDNFAYLMATKYYGAQKQDAFRPNESVQSIVLGAAYKNYVGDTPEPVNLPSVTYFDDYGVVISRGQQAVPFSISIKAGHNDENHNHMDVGSYIIAYGDEILAGDIGAPSYRAGAFSDNNPARSSWGHPVPRINNTLQSKGRKFAGKVLETDFSSAYDQLVMDILPAYEVPELKTLTRSMKNDKTGAGTVTVTDAFTANEPVKFGTAIMTLSDYEIVDAQTLILTENGQQVKAVVTATGGRVTLNDEQVPVEHLREGGPAFRIGVDFVEPLAEGSITVTYTPLTEQ
ncbi:hypothetical protein [Marinoscillum furvescens]|uniref:Heparinase II/III-like protein n=1 Tax=Marinoscillum furvescens DSM 4134 TaxID=1122208 RepID=A0A3D9L0I6_MARFU|nr:hypothetical protein [Marinoscillum furvescens]RED94657.1 hypothetical protein C7460_12052 [Marinoscillum furvescens DSM 4134]